MALRLSLLPLSALVTSHAAIVPKPLTRARGPVSQRVQRFRSGAVMQAPDTSEMIPILVEVEVKPERMDEFMDVMKKDAEGSRTEPGCLRFDVLQDKANPCKFWFYEVYTNAEAAAAHRDFPHFKLWTDFKESGVVSSVSSKPAFTSFGWTDEKSD